MEVQIDIGRFYSKFEEFRRDKLHCDVNVEIGEQVFSCHKVVLSAVSQYFSSMFRGNFEESEKKNVVLNDIDAVIFEQILCFIYTGKITVSDKNSYALLVASEYLGLHCIEDLCTDYIRNDVPISNAIEIFLYAYNTGKASLLEVLKLYIAENFETFYTRSEFPKISVDAMKMLLNCAALQLEKRHDVILHSIIRWVSHNPDERRNLGPELLIVVDFEKVSAPYVKLLSECMVEYKPGYENIDEKCNNSDVLYAVDDSSEDGIQTRVSDLGVFVSSKHVSKRSIRIYRIDRNYQWRLFSSIRVNLNILRCKLTANEENVHYFHYCYQSDKSRHKLLHSQRSFSSNEAQELKSPPLAEKFDVCMVQNNVYFYNKEMATLPSSNSGIYSYTSSLDKWVSVAEPKLKLNGSHLVSCNDVIYLLGGYSVTDWSFVRGYVQSYDHRMPAWSELADTTFRYRDDASACVHDGKIYIAGGSCCPQEAEVFDARAGKWETIKSMRRGRISHKLVSFKNYLWAIGSGTDLSVEMYDCKSNHWMDTTPMDDAVNNVAGNIPGCFSHEVVEAYVHKIIRRTTRHDARRLED